jgi:hypothetical protein
MANKHAYDNSAGYGHGGLGYSTQLDSMPSNPHPRGELPGWVPWAGLAGGAVLGAYGLSRLGKLFRRAPKAPIDPKDAYETAMLGRTNGRIDRTLSNRQEALEQMQRNKDQQTWLDQFNKTSAVITALGRIARGE